MINPEDKTPGRKKGTPNKRSNLALDRIDHWGSKFDTFVSPFDFLLLTMNGIDQDGFPIEVELREKIDCAKTAVQYTNSKLTTTEMVIEAPESEEMTDAEKRKKIEQLLTNSAVKSVMTGDIKDESEYPGTK